MQYNKEGTPHPGTPRTRAGRTSSTTNGLPRASATPTFLRGGGTGRRNDGHDDTHPARIHWRVCGQHQPTRTRHRSARSMSRTEAQGQDRRRHSTPAWRHRRQDLSASCHIACCVLVRLFSTWLLTVVRGTNGDKMGCEISTQPLCTTTAFHFDSVAWWFCSHFSQSSLCYLYVQLGWMRICVTSIWSCLVVWSCLSLLSALV